MRFSLILTYHHIRTSRMSGVNRIESETFCLTIFSLIDYKAPSVDNYRSYRQSVREGQMEISNTYTSGSAETSTENRNFRDFRTGQAVPVQMVSDPLADVIEITIEGRVISLASKDAGDFGIALKYLADQVVFRSMGL